MRHDDGEDNWRDTGRETDFELEVSSLDAPADAAPQTSRASKQDSVHDAGGQEPDDGQEPEDAADAPFVQRMTPRRRTLAAASATAAVVLALVVVLSGAPSGGSPPWQAFFPTPTPTATLAPGANIVYLVHSVPWGALTIDGTRVDSSPVPSKGGFFVSLALARGRHTLVYSATPFPELRCRVSVPAVPDDTCPPEDANLAQSQGVFNGSVRVLDLQATLTHLPSEQYQALAQAVQAALVFPSGAVAPGDHYAQADGTVVVATGALHAALLISLNTDQGTTSRITINGVPCDTLCTVESYVGPFQASQGSWGLLANVQAAWQYTDAVGHVVQTTPVTTRIPGQTGPQTGTPLLEYISARWDGAWSVTVDNVAITLSNICEADIEQLASMIGNLGPNSPGLGFGSQVGRSPSDGCLLTVEQAPTSSGTPYTQQQLGSVLDRYGALVAADAGARRLFPQLPLPSANERALIAAFVAQQAQCVAPTCQRGRLGAHRVGKTRLP